MGRYGNRFQARHFGLADPLWRDNRLSAQAVVSSLCIHYLEANAKQELFKDIYDLLTDGGVFIIADLIEPATPLGMEMTGFTSVDVHWMQAGHTIFSAKKVGRNL